ncbi:efflux RND transporter periplasmic adaptor subunit [Brevibacillus sp. SYSU BS000544]|uniref:efflux RND transporter periplasmic adaptor subunit n=1 Tax=Brevibacillus sp. SYSU BS000544 TaxID=3416443 RepID=UPI003CE51018
MRTKSILSIGILSAMLAVSGCTTQASAPIDEVMTVNTVTAGSVYHSGFVTSGRVAPNEEVTVNSKIGGKIAKVLVEEGAVVKKGDVLAELESSDYLQQVKQAQAGIASANAKLADVRAGARPEEINRLKSTVEQAQTAYEIEQKSFKRLQALFGSGAIAQNDLDKASAELDRKRTAVDQARAQLDLAQAGPTSNSVAALASEVERLQSGLALTQDSLANTVIKSPINGTVVKRNIDLGEVIQPTTSMMTIVTVSDIQIVANVSQEQVQHLKVGSSVIVSTGPSFQQTIEGEVTFVSPVSDVATNLYPIKVKVKEHQGKLRGGMLVDLRFFDSSNNLELPAFALVNKEGKHFVFKQQDNQVKQVEVQIKEINPDWVEVTAGINKGDQIVINPSNRLSDGAKVQVSNN